MIKTWVVGYIYLKGPISLISLQNIYVRTKWKHVIRYISLQVSLQTLQLLLSLFKFINILYTRIIAAQITSHQYFKLNLI
jgi:hypothetical protein